MKEPRDLTPEALAYLRQTEREARQWAREETLRRRFRKAVRATRVLATVFRQRGGAQ